MRESEAHRVDGLAADVANDPRARNPRVSRRVAIHEKVRCHACDGPREGAQQEGHRNVALGDVGANQAAAHAHDPHDLTLARKNRILGAAESRRVKHVNAQVSIGPLPNVSPKPSRVSARMKCK
jgi:hypothetical protein